MGVVRAKIDSQAFAQRKVSLSMTDDNNLPRNVIPPDPELAEELRGSYVRISWAAEHIGVDRSTLYRQVQSGQIGSKRIAPTLTVLFREEMIDWEPERDHRKSED